MIDTLFAALRHNHRRARRMLQDAPLSPARLDGFRVQRRPSDEGSTAEDWYFAFTVTPAGGQPFRTGCKQRLPNSREKLRLGMPLLVRHEGSQRAIIDWAESLDALGLDGDNEAFGWKPLKRPPDNGIEDRTRGSERRRIQKGLRTTGVLVGLEEHVNFLGFADGRFKHLAVDLADSPTGPRQVVIEKERVPDYALRLLHDRARLPVAVDPGRPDRVTIDWEAAASG